MSGVNDLSEFIERINLFKRRPILFSDLFKLNWSLSWTFNFRAYSSAPTTLLRRRRRRQIVEQIQNSRFNALTTLLQRKRRSINPSKASVKKLFRPKLRHKK